LVALRRGERERVLSELANHGSSSCLVNRADGEHR
jgi:hypothetical protein